MADSDGWTLGTLYTHFERLIEAKFATTDASIAANAKIADISLVASQRAADKYEEQAGDRATRENNIRDELRQQSATFATRDLLDATRAALEAQITSVREAQVLTENRTSRLQGQAAALAGAAFIAATVLGYLLHH